MAPDDLNVPDEALKTLQILQRRLGKTLLAAYLHGSAVASGLREKSDVDLLAIIDDPLSRQTRLDLSSDLLAASGHHPVDRLGRRPVELIILRSADLTCLSYPARAEFIYGEWLRPAFESGAVPEAETSPEITLLLAQARDAAIPLTGPDIDNFVPAIPFPAIRKAIGDLLPATLASIDGDERNALLTLARMWRTARTGEFVSKDEAANWAEPLMSGGAAATLAAARAAYLGHSADDLHLLQSQVSDAAAEMRDHILSTLRAWSGRNR